MATQSLSLLLQRASIDDHDEALRVANAALAKSKSDIQAQHVKVVALLKLDRYDDCLRVFEEAGDNLKKRAGVEFAYALYKCGRLDEAIEVVTRLASDRGARHLEAQASYRAEKFGRAAEIYEALWEDKAALANEENDLRINAWATDAQLQWKGYPALVRHTRPTREDLEAFETVYNAACLSIAKGELGQGEMLLKRAKELCRTSDDLTPEDKAAELLPITVQQLFVLIRQGKSEEAESVLKEISLDDISELSTKKIAQTNAALVRGTTGNPYVLYKALNGTPDPTDNDKLFEFQSALTTGNTHAADLLVRKYDGIIRSTSKALSRSPCPSADAHTNLLSVYNAAAHARGETGTTALKAVLAAMDNRPKDLGLALTAVQLYVSAGNTTSAITTLERTIQHLEDSISEQDKDMRFNPGLLAVLVSLYKLEGRRTQIRSELAKAASYWRDQPQGPSSLLRAAAAAPLLHHSSNPSDLSSSSDLFRSLYQKNPADNFAIAGYIAAQAPLDYPAVESQLDRLPSVNDLVADVDVSALEKSGIAPPASAAAAAAAAIAGARKRRVDDSSKQGQGAPAKRIRKSRLPKDYDPSKTADPERWLPLRDRSTYRPKGKKGKQRAAERTQGGPVEENAAGQQQQQQQQKAGGGGSSSKKKGKKGKR